MWGFVGRHFTWTFWCSGLRKLEPAKAKSIQSTLKSSRLQRVPREGMVSGRPGGERVFRPRALLSLPVARTSPG